MVSPRLAPLVEWSRRSLHTAAVRVPAVGRALAVGGRELTRAATVESGATGATSSAGPADDLYGGGYFGVGRDPSGDRQGLSGYASYDRVSSNADITAYLLWRNFRLVRSLDVGSATGYVVEALRERGIDAEGCDVSQFAVDHAAPGAVGHLRLGDLDRPRLRRTRPSTWCRRSRCSSTSPRPRCRGRSGRSGGSAGVSSMPPSRRSG